LIKEVNQTVNSTFDDTYLARAENTHERGQNQPKKQVTFLSPTSIQCTTDIHEIHDINETTWAW